MALGRARLNYLDYPEARRVVAASSSPIARDTPPSINGRPFLSFSPAFHFRGLISSKLGHPETEAGVCNCAFSMGLLSPKSHCVFMCVCVDVHVLALSWPHFEPISMIALRPPVHLLIQ